LSWLVVIALASGNMAFKVAGAMLFARRPMPPWLQGTAGALPLAIYPALVASTTLAGGSGVRVDGRLISAGAVVLLFVTFKKKNLFGLAMFVGALVMAIIHYVLAHGAQH
jgi:hypothetical protein